MLNAIMELFLLKNIAKLTNFALPKRATCCAQRNSTTRHADTAKNGCKLAPL